VGFIWFLVEMGVGSETREGKVYFKKEFSFYQTMVKCSICSKALAELFLDKVKGTRLRKPGSSKQYPVCFECQKKFPTKEALLKQL